jgi:hypothetical protein
MDILFNLVIPKKDLQNIESMSDFVEMIEIKFKRIVETYECNNFEILFIEKIDNDYSFVLHSKDKSQMDLAGKELLIFLLEN